MTYPRSLLAVSQVVSLLSPAADAAGRTSAYVSLKGCNKATILVHITQGNAATIALSLLQATAVAGTSSKALANSVPISADLDTVAGDTEVAQTAGVSFTTDAGIKNKIVVFDVDPAQLDHNNGFDCLGISTGASNAANITGAIAILHGTRYGSGGMSARTD